MSEQITFMNSKGQAITIGQQTPYLLETIEGLGGNEAEMQTQKAPFQDGSTFTDALLTDRLISAEFLIKGADYDEVLNNRQRLAGVLNPKLGPGILRYEAESTTREISALPTSTPILPDGIENRHKKYQRGMIEFLCPDPYWREINPINIKLEDFVSNFRFPFSFPVRFATRGDSRVLVNEGHVPTPIKITFRGESINPKITNQTTGEFIKINRNISAGYTLVINTAFGNKTIDIIAPDGVVTSATGYMDLNSKFFDLEVGENKINFITEGGKPEVYIEYKNRYLGV
ncbi:phage tail family protein [Cytobacillus sp. Hm23]